MRDSWLSLLDSVLRPARPQLERCLAERERHLAARRVVAEGRARAIARCEARIESARAAVFAADDGVVPRTMIELEREWRALSRKDPDGGMMDLWARIAPPAWIDRKLWRDASTEQDGKLDAAIALASDASGVDAAEGAVAALRVALAAWGTPFGTRVRFRAFEHDSACTVALLAEPLRAACDALADGAEVIVVSRARDLERDVHEAARARFPERPLLARDLAHAAFVDCVWRAAPPSALANPVTCLRDLWRAGYLLSEVDSAGVTIELPPL